VYLGEGEFYFGDPFSNVWSAVALLTEESFFFDSELYLEI